MHYTRIISAVDKSRYVVLIMSNGGNDINQTSIPQIQHAIISV